MAWNYEREYRKNIRKAILTVKTSPNEKDIPEGRNIRELKKECLSLLDNIVELPFRPHVRGSSFYVTESTTGFNNENLEKLSKLQQIRTFLLFFQPKQTKGATLNV